MTPTELTKRLGLAELEDHELDIVCEFYDAHPGFAGAGAQIPERIRVVVESLAGTRASLREAKKRILEAAGEGYGVEVLARSILVKSPGDHRTGYHMWKAISYRN